MAVLSILIKNEIGLLTQNKVLKWLSITILLLGIIALWISINEYKFENATRSYFQEKHRRMWLEQPPKNPHMAAHYGTFAFKPANPLSLFDKGIRNFSGSFTYLEAHRQNDFVGSPAQNSSIYLRMGEFNLSFLLQFALPLLILAIASGMFSKEKQDGIYSFMTTNSIAGKSLFYAKSIALFIVISGIVFLIFGGTFFISLLSGIDWNSQQIGAILLLFLMYLLFYFCLINLTLIVSLKAHSFKSAFIMSCSAWIFLFFLLPRLASNFANDFYPLPSNIAFKSAVKKDIDNGIDGHSRGKREEIVIDSLLKKYKVDSTNKLPINIDGVLLMKGEGYSSSVYEIHFKELQHKIFQQRAVSTYLGVINPFLLMRNISMSLCNNNLENEFDFREKAEVYRNYFVQQLNENMMLKSKEGEFKTYKIHKTEFNQIKDFSYQGLGLSQTLKSCLVDIILLLVVVFSIQFYISKIK
jgi:ABC-2 type transport system permease protein